MKKLTCFLVSGLLLACTPKSTPPEAPPPAPVADAPLVAPQKTGTAGSNEPFGNSIGAGLGTRKVVSRPRMVDQSQKTGKVVVEVCVDASGNVISAEYTLRGSTTNDKELIEKSLAAAREYKFAPSDQDRQCGSMTFNFQLK